METPNNQLQVVHEMSPFSNKDSFEHSQRVALMLSKSELVPKRYQNNPGNCLIAMEMANRIGASILIVMQNLNVILGTPAWSSKFLIASINSCGKFSPLRYEEDEKNGGRTRAWAYDRENKEKLFGEWVSMEMAAAEGWIQKAGSKWKTMPGLMRKYRAASFFVNQFAPEISMGFSSAEEVYDIHSNQTKHEPVDTNKEEQRIKLMIDDCETLDELGKLLEHCTTPELDGYYTERKINIEQLTA